ncbi:putative mitochondrial phosphate carrier protein [Westerdykella ornata]|uniref:Putative mitochondrial phosphate carrier protein n=1 Tax=Westerdykella ornata TaxID=318751 RepID=A0A6A6J5N8_WESOR|nr:putative mitochondrial phosphate carrier protein [Westerdykella ornata]KAF2271891.1 putative mitochondrial phosphate carrier protein [Westerdykella ornata]
MPKLLASPMSDVPMKTATSTMDKLTGLPLYARYAFAGAVCCSFTHAVITPIDVIKTRIQLDPGTYNRGMFHGLRKVAAEDGARALLAGFGPTVAGYFVQGAFKFGGYEFFKQQAINWLGQDAASRNRHTVYLTSSAVAEFLGDIALCPFEAVRIRLVSEPTFAPGLWDGFSRMTREEGIRGLYSGLGPILLKQVPYTMATFVVYENVSGLAYRAVDKSAVSNLAVTGINLGSGLVAGMAAALVSQPADTMLSRINKEKGRPGQRTIHRLFEIARDLGIRGSYAGIRARLVMEGGMTAGQFAIYGHIKQAVGTTGGVEIM